MQHIAFFRNVNQGQRGHPSTADLLADIEAAGGSHAVAFRSNGTVVFEAPDGLDVASHLSREAFVRDRAFVERFAQ